MVITAVSHRAAQLLEYVRIQGQSISLSTIWISPAARAAEAELETIWADLHSLENEIRQLTHILEMVR